MGNERVARGHRQTSGLLRAGWPTALLLAVLALSSVGLLAAPAYAHSLLERSVPAAGSSLPHGPRDVLLLFTEPPEPTLSTVSLLDSSGQMVHGIGKPAVAPGNPRELRAALPHLIDGVYTVNWRTVSKVDGHTTAGSFAFGIGVRPGSVAATGGPSTGSGSGNPTPAQVAGLWLLYWGLALLVAAGATGVLVFDWRLPPGARIVLAGGWVLAAAGIVTMTFAERAAVGVPFSELFDSAPGRSLLAQIVAVAVCGVAALVAGLRPVPTTLAALGIVAAGALFTHAQAGHAESQSSIRLLNLTDQWLHMLAAALWVGGLVWLLLGLRRLRGGTRATVVRRFSQLALFSVAVLALTGVLRAVPEVASLGALVSTSFGIVLLIKTGLFLTLMAIAWRNRYLLVPSQAIGSLQRSVRFEVGLAALVLVAAGVLSGLPPASYVEAAAQRAPAPQSVTVTGHDFGTTLRVRLTVTPGLVGSNRFRVQVLRYNTTKPAPARSVRLEFSLPSNPTVASRLGLTRIAAGLWSGRGTNLSIDGQWDIDVVVQEAATGVDVPLRLRTRLPTERIATSRAAGQPTVYTVKLRHGYSLQGYLDPAKVGAGVAHFTFFTASGAEAPISAATAEAITPAGAAQPLKLIRFSKGHFAANLRLTSGRWTFLIHTTGPGPQSLFGYYSQTIRR